MAHSTMVLLIAMAIQSKGLTCALRCVRQGHICHKDVRKQGAKFGEENTKKHANHRKYRELDSHISAKIRVLDKLIVCLLWQVNLMV